VLDDLDLILVMSVNPGFGGQSFIPTTYAKLRELRALVGSRNTLLSVDGGVSPANAALLAQAGAGVLVAGSAIFGAPDTAEAVRALRNASEVPN
jgi:ribulose-phosphate 3-epimerase